MTLGENLQQLRKSAGLSQEEVAGRLFVSRQSVSKWENGQAEPGVENLKALAALYGVTMDQLTGMAPPSGHPYPWTKWGDVVWTGLAEMFADVKAGMRAAASSPGANTGFWASVRDLFTSVEPDTPESQAVVDRERRAVSFYHVVVWTHTLMVVLRVLSGSESTVPLVWLAMMAGLLIQEPFIWMLIQVILWADVALNVRNLLIAPAFGVVGLFLAYLSLCAFLRQEVRDYFHVDRGEVE